MMGGLKFVVTETWMPPEWRMVWVSLQPGRCPPRGKRKGTRKMWKRANPRGLRLRSRPFAVEPDHVLTVGDKVFCTAKQFAAIRAQTP